MADVTSSFLSKQFGQPFQVVAKSVWRNARSVFEQTFYPVSVKMMGR